MQEDGWVVAGGGKKSWKRRGGKSPNRARQRPRHEAGPGEKHVWNPAVLDVEVDEGKAADEKCGGEGDAGSSTTSTMVDSYSYDRYSYGADWVR